MPPLIIVRPEPGASKTTAAALALGLNAISVPLFSVAPCDWTAPDPAQFDALMITSANAARHAGVQLARFAKLPCHAVGAETAAAAREAGLNLVDAGDAGAQALVDALVERGARSILWLAGTQRTRVHPGPARITACAVYDAAANSELTRWDAAIAQPAIIMLHSARAARYAAEIAGNARNHLIALAISPDVARETGPGWRAVHCAAAPNDSAMLALACQLWQTHTQKRPKGLGQKRPKGLGSNASGNGNG